MPRMPRMAKMAKMPKMPKMAKMPKMPRMPRMHLLQGDFPTIEVCRPVTRRTGWVFEGKYGGRTGGHEWMWRCLHSNEGETADLVWAKLNDKRTLWKSVKLFEKVWNSLKKCETLWKSVKLFEKNVELFEKVWNSLKGGIFLCFSFFLGAAELARGKLDDEIIRWKMDFFLSLGRCWASHREKLILAIPQYHIFIIGWYIGSNFGNIPISCYHYWLLYWFHVV